MLYPGYWIYGNRDGPNLNPCESSAPDGSVDLSSSGFTVRVHQILDQRDPRHDIETVEKQLAGELIDPVTQDPYFNEIDEFEPDFEKDANGNFITETINFSDETDPLIGTIGNTGNFTPDAKYPGIPGFGSGGGKDDFAVEAIAFVELKAGKNRLGVNSDDGFRLTIGVATNSKDAYSMQPEGAVFGSSRGAADTEWEMEVATDGLYPVRLITWDGGGGASAEFYTVNPPEAVGQKILVNDPSNPDAAKAFRLPTVQLAFAESVTPLPEVSDVFLQPTVTVILKDAGTQIDRATVKLSFDGQEVTQASSVNKSGGTTTASYSTPDFLEANSDHTATVEFSDTSGNTRAHTWSFTIGTFVVLSPEIAFPADAKDTTAPGFNCVVHQARFDAGLNPSVSRADTQLRGTLLDPFTSEPFANEAAPNTFVESGVVNYEEEERNNGNFEADKPFPGIPGSPDGHDDQFAIELVTYLELEVGFHVFGVHSQDGFNLSVGEDARDLFSAQSIGRASGIQSSSDYQWRDHDFVDGGRHAGGSSEDNWPLERFGKSEQPSDHFRGGNPIS